MKMECEWDGCQYATKEYEPAVAVELLKLHHQSIHQTHAMGGSTTERRCQAGQLICLGQKPDWDTADSSCDLCYNHFRSCPWKTGINWCQGEVCQYDMEKSSNARVARKETTDEATDVRLEHWGRGAELIGDKVAGLEKHVEAPEYDAEEEYDTDTDVSDRYSLTSLDTEGEYDTDTDTEYGTDTEADTEIEWRNGYASNEEEESCAEVPGEGITDEALDVDLEHWGGQAGSSCTSS